MHPLLDLDAYPVIGHQGAAGLAPENTRASLELEVAPALLIELKTVEVAEPVRRLLLEHQAAERVVLASFLAALRPFRDGGFQTGASRRGFSRFGSARPSPLPSLSARRRAGRPAHVWTVNDTERAAFLWCQGV